VVLDGNTETSRVDATIGLSIARNVNLHTLSICLAQRWTYQKTGRCATTGQQLSDAPVKFTDPVQFRSILSDRRPSGIWATRDECSGSNRQRSYLSNGRRNVCSEGCLWFKYKPQERDVARDVAPNAPLSHSPDSWLFRNWKSTTRPSRNRRNEDGQMDVDDRRECDERLPRACHVGSSPLSAARPSTAWTPDNCLSIKCARPASRRVGRCTSGGVGGGGQGEGWPCCNGGIAATTQPKPSPSFCVSSLKSAETREGNGGRREEEQIAGRRYRD
jgi:hypothetical protein